MQDAVATHGCVFPALIDRSIFWDKATVSSGGNGDIEQGKAWWCAFEGAVIEVHQVRISRASHCEPDTSGRWLADLSFVNGPVLGPFSRRADALAAEVAWLEQNGLPVPAA
jgi:hypothetical protein